MEIKKGHLLGFESGRRGGKKDMSENIFSKIWYIRVCLKVLELAKNKCGYKCICLCVHACVHVCDSMCVYGVHTVGMEGVKEKKNWRDRKKNTKKERKQCGREVVMWYHSLSCNCNSSAWIKQRTKSKRFVEIRYLQSLTYTLIHLTNM